MVKIDAVYEGSLKVSLKHEPSGEYLVSSAPIDNQGLGDRFSPTDLLATATISCKITLMGIEARKRNLDIKGTFGTVEKHMIADPFRRVGRLVVNITVKGVNDEADKKALIYVADNCPVRKSISEKVDVEVHYFFEE